MNLQMFWKKMKSPLALLLAITLFFNGWTNYDFSVFAAEDDLNITLSSSSAVYTGGDLTPTIVSVADAKEENKIYAADSYQAVWSKGETPVTEIKDVGNYKVTVTVTETVPADEEAGTEETTVTKTGSKEFKVTQLNLASCTVEVNGEYTYTGEAIEPAKEKVSVSNGDVKVASELYTVDFGSKANVDAGDYGITVTAVEGNSNVTGSASGTYHIARKKIGADDVTLSAKEGIYNKEEKNQKPEVTVVVGGKTLELNSDYSVTYSDEQMNQVKTYTITVEGMKNYTGKETKTYTISYGTEGTLNYNGQTLDDSVYAGTVTVTASDATLSTDPKGEFTDSITFTEDSVIPKNVYVLTADNNVNEVELKTLSFDNAAPTLTVTEPDNTTWNSAKEISVKAEDKNLKGVYYTEKANILNPGRSTEIPEGSLSSDLVKEIPSGLIELKGEKLSIKDNIKDEKVYYFYAIDKAGHVSKAKATVKMVDMENPVITIKSGEVESYDQEQKVFWKNADPLTIPFEVTDNLSGIKSIKVTKDGEDKEKEITDGILENRLSAEISYKVESAGTYTITVTDEAGNEETSTFVVIQDSKAPEVALSEPTCTNLNNRYKDTEKNVWWFSENTVKIPFTVTDECGDGEKKSPYKVFWATDDKFTDEDKATVSEDQGTVKINLTSGTHTYYFKVTDKAGNVGEIQSVTIGYDNSEPKITKVEMPQLNKVKEDKWINAEEFDGKKVVEFSVTANDPGSGIGGFEYSYDNGTTWNEVEKYTENDGVYTFVTNDMPEDGANYAWKIRVTDNVKNFSDICLTENNSWLGQIDTEAPKASGIKIDPEGMNIQIPGISNAIKAFLRETFSFEIYVSDATSGIDSFDFQYTYSYKNIFGNEKEETETIRFKNLEEMEGMKAFREEDGESYSVYVGDMSISATAKMKEFKIINLTDKAGNKVEEVSLQISDGMLYVDAVHPKLTVKIGSETDIGEKKTLFYNEEKEVILTIEEALFSEGEEPEVYLIVNDASGKHTEVKKVDENWTHVDNSDEWQYKVQLEKKSGKEIEYQISFTYNDPSGNSLEAMGGSSLNIKDGTYNSTMYVIDDVAPKITSVSIDGNEVTKNDTYFYNSAKEVTVTLEDTYFKDNSNKPVVKLIATDASGKTKTVDEFDSDSWEQYKKTNQWTYTINLDKVDASEIEYQVVIENSYKDLAGNQLTNPIDAEGKEIDNGVKEDGTFASKIFVIDDVAPKITSVSIDGNEVTENDAYFYNSAKEVTVTLEDTYFEKNNNKPVVKLSAKDVSGNAKIAAVTNSEWKQVDGTNQWTNTINLGEKEASEIEYQIVIDSAYKDLAGNQLTNPVDKDGNKIDKGVQKNGHFQSKTFVIDTLAPKITKYSVESEITCTVNNAKVLKNIKNDDTQTGGLKVSFTLDDNAEYYDESKEKLNVSLYKDEEKEPVATWDVNNENLTQKSNGREHSYSFSYDGETDTENKFHVEITYMDQAKNNLICAENLGIKQSTENNGTCVSDEYIIDYVKPTLKVEYSAASNVVDKNGENAEGNTPLAGHTAYYNEDVKTTLTFTERFGHFKNESADLEHFEISIEKDGEELKELPEITWSHDGDTHIAEFTLAAASDHTNDGDYQFEVTYSDCAGNEMDASASKASNENTEKDGVYKSPILVIDTIAPIVETRYDRDVIQSVKYSDSVTKDYLQGKMVNFYIKITDRNIRYNELASIENTTMVDINGKEVQCKTTRDFIKKITKDNANYIHRCTGQENPVEEEIVITLQEADYSIPIYFKDLAGNPAVVTDATGTEYDNSEGGYTEYVVVDKTKPSLDLSYSIEDKANYLEWGYLFAKAKMTISAKATDNISGVQTIKFEVVDENGRKTTKYQKFEPSASGVYSVTIPLYTNDFKGTVDAEVVDYCANKKSVTRGHIVESSSKHSATGKAEITTITQPSRTVNGVDFYNEDVKFKLLLEDSYSGIAELKYVGGNTLRNEKHYKKDAGADLSKDPSVEIQYKYEETLKLDAQANNENDILVTAEYTDNAGYKLNVEEKYNIDVTKPIITVEYDLNDPANGKYYKETRVATVKIRERNFDPNDVEWLITSTDGPQPEISSWSQSGSGDDTMNVCTVSFSTDSDYTFSLKFMDMAGNVADYDRVDEFTIDKTKPEVTVTYDNNSYLNEYYYDASRTATIDILEHNFDPTAIEIMITADDGTAGVPHISGWSQNGDHNITTITFNEDAEYTFDIAGMDLALNELDDYTPDHFVVDQTPPELEIFDIEDMSANNGEVRPGIRYHDTNYDADGTEILMTGYNNGVVSMNGTRKLEANGLELKLDDFAYVQEMDDLYTMEAIVYDLAGNSSEAKVMFSVNRFGSVYTYDDATEALVGENGAYYTKAEQALSVTETNVDTLEFKEITVNLNGKLTTLVEGQDFTVRASGTDATWKQYQYNIKADNFKEEGTYIVTIYSEDRATNISDNNTKGKKLEFVLDKTDPSVIVSGVETNGQYKAATQDMLIDIDDNVLVSNVSVIIDGVETVFDAAQIADADGRLTIGVDAANHAQDIKITVTDAAGNSHETEITNVRVNANIFVLLYLNKVLFYGTLGGCAVGAALLWWFLVGNKKRKEEQAQNNK